MGKKHGHGRKPYQPEVNLTGDGQVQDVYSWLFPKDAKRVVMGMRDWDTAYIEQHPDVREYVRDYVPGEAYPKHDPSIHYVIVRRFGNLRARMMVAELPKDVPFVQHNWE